MEQPTHTKELTQPTVDVPVELLKNLRNILAVANSRIHWKTEELLPVGKILQQLDDAILQGKPKHRV